MAVAVEVGRGVAAWRAVATTDVSTGLADTEVDPVVASPRQAVLAAGGVGRAVGDLVEVGAGVSHMGTLQISPHRRIAAWLPSIAAMRRATDGAMRRLARLLIRIFFRRIELEGFADLPVDVPTVVVANHINGLVDALLLLMATLPSFPHFLGKSTLFRILPLWPFLKLAGVVPVYRAKDGESTARNESSFRTCRRLLVQRGQVALFPEGISHDESMLQPLKTGAARIALGAAVDDGVTGVVIVPVGLSYDAKATFRSRALVQVGAAREAERWADRYRADGHQAARDLTAELADALATVGPSYRSWVQAMQFRQIAEIVARRVGVRRVGAPRVGIRRVRAPLMDRGRVGAGAAGDVDLAPVEAMARRLAATEAAGRRGAELAALLDASGVYERDLALIGLSDKQVSPMITGSPAAGTHMVDGAGGGRPAGRRRRSGGPRGALPDHEKAGRTAAQREHQGHRQAARVRGALRGGVRGSRGRDGRGVGPVGRTGRRHCGARLRLRRRAVGRAGENGSGAWWPGRGFCGSDEPCWGRC